MENDKRAVRPILSLLWIDTPHHQTNSEGSNERTRLVEFEVVPSKASGATNRIGAADTLT